MPLLPHVPFPPVPVPRGDCVEFHSLGAGPARKWTWEAKAMPFDLVKGGPCGTDVVVRRRVWHRREQGGACLLEWDCSWQHALLRLGMDPATDLADLDSRVQGSPYAAVLFVEFEGTPRAALLAYALAAERGFHSSGA